MRTFLDRAEAAAPRGLAEQERATWVQSNFITYDTDILAAQAAEKSTALSVTLAKEAARFQGLALPEELSRKLLLLRLAIVVPAPSDPAKDERARGAPDGDGKRVRPGEVLSGGHERGVLGPPRDGENPRGEPRSQSAPRRLAGMARCGSAPSQGLRPLRGARQRGRAGARVRRPRRDVALEVRHAAGRAREGARPALAAGETALRLASRLRAKTSRRDLRQGARFPPTVPSPRIFSETCGPSSGETSTPWSRPRTRTPATT